MRVMVPPEGRDVTGEKVRVTDTQGKRAIRSDKAMANDTDACWRKDEIIVVGTLNQMECSLKLFHKLPRNRQLIFKSACDAVALLQDKKIRSHMSLPNVHSGPIITHE